MSGPVRWLAVVAVTVGANAVIFGLSDLLSRERPRPLDITEPVPVDLVRLRPPETPRPEEAPVPEEPRPTPRLDFRPRLAPPALAGPDPDAVAVRLDVGLTPGTLDLGGIVFDGAELDRPPRAVVRTEPPYPYRARRRNVKGSVTVKLLVRADGSVGEVEILDARPPGYFEDAVRQTVPRWRFEPGRLAGEAVPSWAVTTITFDLEG